MISHLKAAAIKEKKKKRNRFKEARPVFKGIFKKLTLCMSALNHAVTDARIMIFKLFKGFLNVLYRKNISHIIVYL